MSDQDNPLANSLAEAERVMPCHNWLTIESLRPGMVLARPVIVAENDKLALHLAEGTELTESSIAQIFSRGVQCAAIVVPPEVKDEAQRARVEAYGERLMAIFGCEDELFLGEDCRPLYEALHHLGPPRCTT